MCGGTLIDKTLIWVHKPNKPLNSILYNKSLRLLKKSKKGVWKIFIQLSNLTQNEYEKNGRDRVSDEVISTNYLQTFYLFTHYLLTLSYFQNRNGHKYPKYNESHI